MTASQSPMALQRTWDLVADAYSKDVAPHFVTFADAALDDAVGDVGDAVDAEIVDVACGPGTVSLRALARGLRVKAIDFSPEMIDRLHIAAAAQGVHIDAVVGDGQHLPYGDHVFDAGISLFGLVFFPDRQAGLSELRRVVKPGGAVVVTSWVPLDRVPLMHDAVSTLMAVLKAPLSQTPGPMATQAAMTEEFTAAGFVDVEISERSAMVPFSGVTELLRWMERSTAPIVAMKSAMGDAAFAEVFLRWQVAMMALHGGKVLELPLIALFGKGRTPR